MCSASFVTIALFAVASSQIAAESDQQLQAFDHDFMAIGNGTVKSLPKRSPRGSRDVRDNLATEERTVYSTLARIIKNGVSKMPLVAVGARKMPHTAEAMKTMPHAAETMKKKPHDPELDLSNALEDAEAALKKHWELSDATKAIGDAPHDMVSRKKIDFPTDSWDINFRTLRSVYVHKQHLDKIKPVYEEFVRHCDKNLHPTAAETSYLWRMFDSNIPSSSNRDNYLDLVRQARQNVHHDVSKIHKRKPLWEEWETFSKSLKVHVLDTLLNLHYQRWARMYDIFKQERPDLINAPSNLKRTYGGNKGSSSATALRKHSKVLSSSPFEPLNAASTPRGGDSVFTKRSKRTFDDITDTASPLTWQSKMRSSEMFRPLFTESTTSGDHPFSTKKLRLGFGGTSNVFHPQKHPNVHSSKSVAPASTALTLKDDDTRLSLGGIYRKNSD